MHFVTLTEEELSRIDPSEHVKAPGRKDTFLDTALLRQRLSPAGLPDKVGMLGIDFRTLAHPIAFAMDKAYQEGCELTPRDLAEAMWGYRLTHLGAEVRDYFRVKGCGKVAIVIAEDSPAPLEGQDKKGYWRHYIHPEYKAGRPSKPDHWSTITSAGYSVALDNQIPVVSSPHFEADDILAHWARELPKYADSLVIHTLDTDLLQLVDDSKAIAWYNVLRNDRFRDEAATLAYWKKRHKRVIQTPKDIVEDKARYGDRSDNIPPNSQLLRGIIDLWNPTEPYNIEQVWVTQSPRTVQEWVKIQESYLKTLILAGGSINVAI